MAKNERATSTGGANGPRGDEPKTNTVSPQAQNALLATFDDLDMSDLGDAGNSSLNPQERHGLGGISVSDQSRYLGGPNGGANDDPNMAAHGYAEDPNDAGLPPIDGADYSENPRNLPNIPPREGFSNCWVSWFLPDGNINQDLQRMIRRGYAPVPVEAVPKEIARFLQKRKDFDGADMLSVSGMVLCEIPLARLRKLVQMEQEQHQRNERATLTSAQDANRDASRHGSSMQIGIEQKDI